jgi:hypothetical protein
MILVEFKSEVIKIDFPIDWPEVIIHYLFSSYGTPKSIEKINGIKTDGGVFRVHFKYITVIVKNTKQHEYYFGHTSIKISIGL